MCYQRPFLLSTLLAFATCSGFAQPSTASLSVVVEDALGGRVPEARVIFRDTLRGFNRECTTDAAGLCVFDHLLPGAYQLEVEKTGFAPFHRPDVELFAGDQRLLVARLELAGRVEAVEVTAQAPLIRETPSVATTVERAFFDTQPLNGRTFQALISLAPGVVLVAASLPSQGQFSANGQRAGANYFTVDGVSANYGLPFATTPYEGAGGSIPALSALGTTGSLASTDAVQEFTIQTSSYAPEYGRQPGAQVAIVTRAGTNQFHGSFFDYFRNDKLDANSWFGNYYGLRRPALRQNDFGFTLGGPVVLPGFYHGRDRSFFFISYEGLRLVQPVVSQPSRVPSREARERATGLLKAILEAYPQPVAPPLPEAPLETPYVASFSNPSSLNAWSVRLDQQASSRLTVFGRFHHAPSEIRERGRYATPSFVAVLPADNDSVTVGTTILHNSGLTHDLRFQWGRSRASQIYVQDTFGGAKILPYELVFPSFARPETSLFYLSIGANDENTISPGTFSRNTQRQLNLVATSSWLAGRHQFKLGADWRRLAPSIGGRLYSKVLIVPTITDLVSGIVPVGEIREVDQFLEPRYLNFSLFLQDVWRVTTKLVLTYGIRWEVNPAPTEANGNLPLTVLGIDRPQTARLAPRGTRFYETTYGNVAPRLGVAYRLWRDRGLVFRGGFGVFYDLGYAFTGTAFSPSNYPYSRVLTVSNRPIDDPIFSSHAGPQSYDPPYPRLFAFYPGYKLPCVIHYNVGFEQPIGRTSSLWLGYVGAAGRRLARVESLRPAVLQNPQFTRIDAVSNLATSDYHALQVQFRRRMASGLQALVSYAWSKSLDTASDESIVNFAAPAVKYDPRLDRGPSDFDVRHNVSGAFSWELPRPRAGLARSIAGGFALDAVLLARTATPVTPVTGRDALNLGLTNVSRPDYVAGRPLYLFSEGYPGGKRINPAAFDAVTPVAQGRQGTLGRGSLRAFPLRQLDVSLRRRFQLAEGWALDFRADAFNVLNTPNFASPVYRLTSPSFGLATTTFNAASVNGLNPLYQVGGPRSIQLSLKLKF